jgi:hypothetical protein
MREGPSELAGVLDLGLDEHVGAHGLVLHGNLILVPGNLLHRTICISNITETKFIN